MNYYLKKEFKHLIYTCKVDYNKEYQEIEKIFKQALIEFKKEEEEN